MPEANSSEDYKNGLIFKSLLHIKAQIQIAKNLGSVSRARALNRILGLDHAPELRES